MTMTKKSKSKNEVTKKKPATKIENEMALELDRKVFDAVLASFRAATTSTIDKRKELLARVAGSVAAGLVNTPSPSITTSASMATVAVDIADEILKKAGIPLVDHAAESSSSGNAAVGAAT
jgi:hypothetical protein